MVTKEEMVQIDRDAIEKLGVPSIVLMENAAIHTCMQLPQGEDNYLIIASTGNNGGDGMAIARHLVCKGKMVKIFIIGDPQKGSDDFKTNYEIDKNLKIPMTTEENELDFLLEESEVIIDCIFGTGLSREVEGRFKQVIEKVNQIKSKVYSIDIPSGLDANEGIPMGIAIKADKTYTMHDIKVGLEKSRNYSGEIYVSSIGIPNTNLTKNF